VERLLPQSIAFALSDQHERDVLTNIVHSIDINCRFRVLLGMHKSNLDKRSALERLDDRSVERPEPKLVLAFVVGVAYAQVVGHW